MIIEIYKVEEPICALFFSIVSTLNSIFQAFKYSRQSETGKVLNPWMCMDSKTPLRSLIQKRLPTVPSQVPKSICIFRYSPILAGGKLIFGKPPLSKLHNNRSLWPIAHG